MVNVASKIYNFLAPAANKGEDGRDVWGSRLSFIFAAMGGAVGLGNLLRFPSIVYNNHGLQFFIPYLISLFCLAIPTLLLEISIGQAYRGGCVLAWHHAHRRAKGVGFGVVYIGYAICIYYVPIIAWIMSYFRHSFISPLPWEGRNEDFFYGDVLQNVDPIPGNLTADGSAVQDYSDYPSMGMNTEVTLWNLFTWFIVWLCMYKGVGLMGRVVYFTMALPIILMIVLIGRGCSLPNAIDGMRIYWTEWHGNKLASGKIWQEACGQVFFSTGIGMGYYTSFASYNQKYSNAVQDALIICISNSLIEIIGSMSVFGVVGYLGMHPDTSERLNTFVVGFLTYPEAIAEMPGANFWGVLFFATLFILGLGSAFALLETLVTMVCDTDWGKKYPPDHIAFKGNELRRDLNATISTSGQWKIPAIWGFVLKYNTAPIVSIIFSFAYPNFYAKNRMDPLHISGFTFMHVVLAATLVGLVMPRWFNVLVPKIKSNRRGAQMGARKRWLMSADKLEDHYLRD
ncbi:Creatine transporter [Colletotrichum sp. SAR 10_99]|nr:Creatine transporter [Colletotrichum sp. SAR 10_99]